MKSRLWFKKEKKFQDKNKQQFIDSAQISSLSVTPNSRVFVE